MPSPVARFIRFASMLMRQRPVHLIVATIVDNVAPPVNRGETIGVSRDPSCC